jgi:homoserine kinase type II
MAVFTEVTPADAQRLAAALGLGDVTVMEPIRSGIENTNYFVDTTRGRWVLTLFERLRDDQLPFYLHLMKHLARRGLPVPEPQADKHGEIAHRLAGKPAALVNRLPGRPLLAPEVGHCEQLGTLLARLHGASADFKLSQPNLRGLAWWIATAPRVRPFLRPTQVALLDSELAYQQQLAASAAYARLPHAAIHADLFRDNVMFDGASGQEALSGVIDFYFAGVDTLLFDMAVCINDWCADDATGRIDEARAAALVAAYSRVRAIDPGEARMLPALLRAAALRFWLSRLADMHLPRDATLLEPKDPVQFENVLRQRVAQPWHPLV